MGKELSCGVYVHPCAMDMVVGDRYVPEYGVQLGDTITFDKPRTFYNDLPSVFADSISVRIIDAEYAVLEVS